MDSISIENPIGDQENKTVLLKAISVLLSEIISENKSETSKQGKGMGIKISLIFYYR